MAGDPGDYAQTQRGKAFFRNKWVLHATPLGKSAATPFENRSESALMTWWGFTKPKHRVEWRSDTCVKKSHM
jgi:hypothetical protein